MDCYYVFVILFFFFECYRDTRELPVLTRSFPTRRSSDLAQCDVGQAAIGADIADAGEASVERDPGVTRADERGLGGRGLHRRSEVGALSDVGEVGVEV